MTLNDLKKEVAALGFESSIELDEAFLYCANRALLTIFTERPVRRTARLSVTKTPYISHTAHLTHHSGAVITLPLSCKCASFRVSGIGRFVMIGADTEDKVEFDTSDSLFRIFSSEYSEIRFEGEYYFEVYNLTLYGEIFGEDEQSIPEYSEGITIDLAKRHGDFLAFLDAPRSIGGQRVEFISMHDGKITLPCDSASEIALTYARLPRKIYDKKKYTIIMTLILVVVFWACVYCMYMGLDDPFLYYQF